MQPNPFHANVVKYVENSISRRLLEYVCLQSWENLRFN